MAVAVLDHINIVASDLARTIEFYERLLGLTRFDHPMFAGPEPTGAWLCDGTGHPVIHVQKYDPAQHDRHSPVPAATTGSIDHVAFRCEDYEAMRAHVDALGEFYQTFDFPPANIRQIRLTDPDNVLLELNFPLHRA